MRFYLLPTSAARSLRSDVAFLFDLPVWWLWICLLMLVVGERRTIAATQRLPQFKGAVAVFSTDSSSYREATTAREFSDALSAAIMDFDRIEWVERADANALLQELQLSNLGFGQTKGGVRTGQWNECDLIIVGRFASATGSEKSLLLEIIQPQRAELLISTNLQVGTLALGSKAVFEALERVAASTKQLLAVACDLETQHQELVSVALVAAFDNVQNQKGMYPPNVGKLVSETFIRELESTRGVRQWNYSRHQQGRQESGLIRGDFLRSMLSDWGKMRASCVVANITNVEWFAQSGPDAGWTDRYDLRFAILDVSGQMHFLSGTNLRLRELTNAVDQLARNAITLATNRVPHAAQTNSLELMGSVITEWAGQRSFNLADYSARLSWLDHVGALEMAGKLGWQVPGVRIQLLRATYEAVSGLPRTIGFRDQLEIHDRWQMILDEFAAPGRDQRSNTLRLLGAQKLQGLTRSSLLLLTQLRWGSHQLGDVPPKVFEALAARLELQFLQRARLTIQAADYSPEYGEWAMESVVTPADAALLATQIAGTNRLVKQRQSSQIGARASSLSTSAADRFVRTNLPLFAVKPRSEQALLTDFRVASSLPPRLDVTIESFAPDGLPEIRGLIDMVCTDHEVFLLLAHEEEVQDLERERNVGVNLGLATVPVTRVWAFNPELNRIRKVASLPLTNRFNRLAWHLNRVWVAGDFITSIDPKSFDLGPRYSLPPSFRGPLLGLAFQEGGLVAATEREVAQLVFASGQWKAIAVPPTLEGGRLLSTPRGIFLASNRHFGWLETNTLRAITPQLLQEGVPPEGFASLLETSGVGGIWIAGQYGLMHYDATNLFSAFQPAAPQSPAFDNFLVFANYCTQQRAAHTNESNYHPFRPRSRFRGGIQDLRADGDFLWTITAGGDTGAYGRRFMLMYQPTRQWIGYVPVPSVGSPIALGKGCLWVLNSALNSGDRFRLGRIDCRPLYATPRSSWVGAKPDRAEMDQQVSGWTVQERILDAFIGGSYSNCLRLIRSVSPLEEDPQLDFILALAAQTAEVRRPEVSVQALRSIMARELETDPWHQIAKGNLPLAQLMVNGSSTLVPSDSASGSGVLPFEAAEAALRDASVVKVLYGQYDLNDDGRLDSEELGAMDIEREANAPHIAVRLFLIDLNRDQAVDQSEKILLYGALRAQAERLLIPYDIDRDGFLSPVEAKALQQNPPNTAGGFWPSHRFGLIDMDHDGKLSYREIAWHLIEVSFKWATDSSAYLSRMNPELLSHDKNGNGFWDPPEVVARLREIHRLDRASNHKPVQQQVQTKP